MISVRESCIVVVSRRRGNPRDRAGQAGCDDVGYVSVYNDGIDKESDKVEDLMSPGKKRC